MNLIYMTDKIDFFKKIYNNLLKNKFNYDSLKDQQFEIIYNICNLKKNVIAILNTGFGKSMCYIMPYLITSKNIIIISPLLSLMLDQQIELQKLNIPVLVLNSNNSNKSSDKLELLKNDNKNKLIFITPEYLVNCEDFIKELINQDRLGLIAIDEAHCISSWGSDFRKDYKNLNIINKWTEYSVPILGLTATATNLVKDDMIKSLDLDINNTTVIVGNFDRDNIFIGVRKKSNNIINDIKDLIDKYPNDRKIIYCNTRKETEYVTELLKKSNYNCEAYHAGLSDTIRDDVHNRFKNNTVNFIVGTCAFGMGINIKNVRLVIHYNLPKNISEYYQEIGRAGRDGLYSEAHLFYSNKDFMINNFLLDKINDIKYKNLQKNELNLIEKYVATNLCRRLLLLRHFDPKYSKFTCDLCDNCNKKNNINNNIVLKNYTDITLPIFKLIHLLNGKYGTNTYINILRGSNAAKITTFMKNLKFYNSGARYSTLFYKELFNILINDGFLIEDSIGRNIPGKVLRCSTKTNNILKSDNIIININETKYLLDLLNKSCKSKFNDDVFTDDILEKFNINI